MRINFENLKIKKFLFETSIFFLIKLFQVSWKNSEKWKTVLERKFFTRFKNYS